MFNIRKMVIEIPTYDAEGPVEYDQRRSASLILNEEDGLRVTMGEEPNAPDVVFEKTVNGWRLFVRADQRDEEMCFIEFTDTHAVVTPPRPKDEPVLIRRRMVS